MNQNNPCAVQCVRKTSSEVIHHLCATSLNRVKKAGISTAFEMEIDVAFEVEINVTFEVGINTIFGARINAMLCCLKRG